MSAKSIFGGSGIWIARTAMSSSLSWRCSGARSAGGGTSGKRIARTPCSSWLSRARTGARSTSFGAGIWMLETARSIAARRDCSGSRSTSFGAGMRIPATADNTGLRSVATGLGIWIPRTEVSTASSRELSGARSTAGRCASLSSKALRQERQSSESLVCSEVTSSKPRFIHQRLAQAPNAAASASRNRILTSKKLMTCLRSIQLGATMARNSIRRFLARPSALALSASGRSSPDRKSTRLNSSHQ